VIIFFKLEQLGDIKNRFLLTFLPFCPDPVGGKIQVVLCYCFKVFPNNYLLYILIRGAWNSD
jgi:hypothetical protein